MTTPVVSALVAAGLMLAAPSAFAGQANGNNHHLVAASCGDPQAADNGTGRIFISQTPEQSVSGQRERAEDFYSVIRSQRPFF